MWHGDKTDESRSFNFYQPRQGKQLSPSLEDEYKPGSMMYEKEVIFVV